jgi:hypothetical protein
MQDEQIELRDWGMRTVGYARAISLAGRTGKVVAEETEQSAITAQAVVEQLWNAARDESHKRPWVRALRCLCGR